MADTKITDLAALTGVASGDLLGLVDISDTSMAATGTDKKVAISELFTNPTLAGLTIADATNIILNSTTGTKIGTSTSQKLGFFNATPIAQPIATTDIGTVLSNLGLRASGTAYPLTTSGAILLGDVAQSRLGSTPLQIRTDPTSTVAGEVSGIRVIVADAAGDAVGNPQANDFLPFYGQVSSTANRTRIWGFNSVTWVRSGFPATAWGAEFDINNDQLSTPPEPNATNHIVGVMAASGGTYPASAGYITWASGTANAWKYGMWLDYVGNTGLLNTGSALIAANNTCNVDYGIDLQGPSYGLGSIRLPNNKAILGRNAANSADLSILTLDNSNNIVLGGTNISSIIAALTTAGGTIFTFNNNQVVPQSTDINDTALKVYHTINAVSATNELVMRCFQMVATNALTGGGVVQNLRAINTSFVSNASTTTTAYDAVYVENGSISGTTTQARGLYVDALPGTSRAGMMINSLSGGTNYSYAVLGTNTIPSGKYGVYQAGASDLNFFAGLMGHGIITPTYGLHQLGAGIRLQALGTPAAPSASTSTTGGSIPAGTYFYWVVAEDLVGNKTINSAVSASRATTGTTSTNTVTWTAVPGAAKYYILRSTSGTIAANTQVGTVTTTNATAGTPAQFTDTFAAATTTFALTTRDSTADLTVDGAITIGSSVAPPVAQGRIFFDSTQLSLSTGYGASATPMNIWQVGTFYSQYGTSTPVAASQTNSTLFAGSPSSIGSRTMAAGFLAVGKSVRLTAYGVYTGSATLANNAITLKLNMISSVPTTVQLAITPVFTVPISQTNASFEIDILITCVTTGTSGTVRAQGSVTWMTSGVASGSVTTQLNSTAAATINTTLTEQIDITATTGTGASAVTVTNCIIEALN